MGSVESVYSVREEWGGGEMKGRGEEGGRGWERGGGRGGWGEERGREANTQRQTVLTIFLVAAALAEDFGESETVLS